MSAPATDPALLSAAAVAGPVRLLAGPGAGKTHALVELYCELVREGRAGRGEILVLTFSAGAAEELVSRIDERLNDSYDQAWISTFHGFCARLLRDHLPDPSRLLLSGFQEWVAMRQVLGEVEAGGGIGLGELASSGGFARDVLSLIALLKQNLVYPPAFSMAAEVSGSERTRRLAAVYAGYQDRLEAAGMVDFRDLVTGAIGLLESRPAVLLELRRRFRYILVDEFQDVDPAQFAVLRLLAPPPERPRIVVAGDADQSIYSFRGTQPRLLEVDFPRLYEGTRTVRLDRSRRCPAAVMTVARRVLGGGGVLPAGASDQVAVTGEATAEDEAFYVAREIRRILLEAAGTLRPRDVAILLRSTSTRAAPFEEALRAMQVDAEVRGAGAAARNEALRFFCTYLQSLIGEEGRDGDSLERLLSSRLSGAGAGAVGRVRAYARERARPFSRSLRQLMYVLAGRDPEAYPLPWGGDPPPAPARVPEYIELLDADECRGLHRALTAHVAMRRRARDLTVSGLAYAILMETGVLDRLLSPASAGDEREEAIGGIRSALAALDELQTVFERLHGRPPLVADVAGDLERLLAAAADETEAAPGRRDAVQIMTVHQAKGLEFEVVFVAGLGRGVFPPPPREHPLLDDEDRRWIVAALPGFQPSWPAVPAGYMEEEARLAYVAMTRARSRLQLTFAHRYEKPDGPSAFLDAAADLPWRDRTRSAHRLDAGAVVTLGEAETVLATAPSAIDSRTAHQLEALGVDLGFVLDPESGRPFFPHEGSRPSGVDPHHFSATDLTAYLKCPRLYWYNHHPGLVAPERGPALERGSFLHAVLEEFHRREDEWYGTDDAERRRWLEEVMAPLLERHLENFESDLERRREELEVRAILDNYVRFLTASKQAVRRYRTLKVEQRFVLQLDGAEIHGKIDRINDTGNGTHEVLDYKTGGASRLTESYAAYFGPEMYDVQLALYQLACREGVDEEGNPLDLNPRFLSLWYPKEWFRDGIRQVLFSIGNPFAPARYIEQPLTDSDIERGRAVVAGAVARIRSGDFAPNPRNVVGTCAHRIGCPHAMICPYGGSAE